MTHSISAAIRNIMFLSALMLCQLACSQTTTVEVTDPRPVAEAVAQLERIYGWPITYEDPIIVYGSRMEDITEQVQRAPGLSHRVMGRKEGRLSFTFRLPSSLPDYGGDPLQYKTEAEKAIMDALASILKSYAASGAPETFAVREEDGIFHMVPTGFLNKEGKLQPMEPILDTKITIVSKQRTRQSLLDEICQSLTNASEIDVECLLPFDSRAMQKETTISGSDVVARTLISQLMAELTAPTTVDVFIYGPDGEKVPKRAVLSEPSRLYSWQLLYGIGDGYALSAHRVALADR